MYTSEKVKRFDFTVLGEGALKRFEDKDGHYIHCADYEAAEARIKELEDLAARGEGENS